MMKQYRFGLDEIDDQVIIDEIESANNRSSKIRAMLQELIIRRGMPSVGLPEDFTESAEGPSEDIEPPNLDELWGS